MPLEVHGVGCRRLVAARGRRLCPFRLRYAGRLTERRCVPAPRALPPACGSLRLSHSLAECVVCAGRAGLRRMPMRRGAVRTRRGDATRSSSLRARRAWAKYYVTDIINNAIAARNAYMY